MDRQGERVKIGSRVKRPRLVPTLFRTADEASETTFLSTVLVDVKGWLYVCMYVVEVRRLMRGESSKGRIGHEAIRMKDTDAIRLRYGAR